MARLVVALLFLGCRGVDEIDRAAQLLVVPAGGRVERPVARADRVERVVTTVCYDGDGARLSAPLRAELEAAGWREVVVERHPALRGRWSVRAVREGFGLAGVVEEGAAGCPGSRLSLGAHVLPEGAGRRTAGPGSVRQGGRFPRF